VTRAELTALGKAVAHAQVGSAGVYGHRQLLGHLGERALLRKAVALLREAASEQVARWSRVVVLCGQLLEPDQADTEPPPPPESGRVRR
jgi:hypothetical protein